jgi:hypothetical protein
MGFSIAKPVMMVEAEEEQNLSQLLTKSEGMSGMHRREEAKDGEGGLGWERIEDNMSPGDGMERKAA